MVVSQARRRSAFFLALAIASASLQVAVAVRWEGRTQYITALVLGWCGALFSLWLRRAEPVGVASAPHQIALGGALWVGACAAAVATRDAYQLVDRFSPLAAGIGLVVMSSGLRSVPRSWRELAPLSLTLLYPLPFALQQALMPTPLTAATVVGMLRAIGFAASRDGTLLRLPGQATLRVFDACSGMLVMTQILVLAVLVLCLFPTTLWRAAAVVLTGLVAGFAVNAVRVALLAVVASRSPSEFEYWESYVAGSAVFPAVATAIAGAAWWGILRSRVRGCAGAWRANRPASAEGAR